jgi:hypothetical protein
MNKVARQSAADLRHWFPLAVACLLQAGCVALHHHAGGTETFKPVSSENSATETTLSPPRFDEPPAADPQPLRFAMQAPTTFQWKNGTPSAGGRPLQYSSVGDGPFRVIVIGSTKGNDPAALELTEKLASHLHENSLIYGGFQALVIRTLNPDGAAEKQSVNSHGQNVNREFLTDSRDRGTKCPEAEMLMRLIEKERPHRIMHIRTVNSPVGVLGSDSDAAPLTATISQSLGFTRFLYPTDIAAGTIERYCSSQRVCQVITFAFPDSFSAADAWDSYHVELLNMLQPDHTSLPKTETTVSR